MGPFQRDIERINQMIDEVEDDIDRATRRIEVCLDQLDELSAKIANASKALREQAALQRANIAAGAPRTTH